MDSPSWITWAEPTDPIHRVRVAQAVMKIPEVKDLQGFADGVPAGDLLGWGTLMYGIDA